MVNSGWWRHRTGRNLRRPSLSIFQSFNLSILQSFNPSIFQSFNLSVLAYGTGRSTTGTVIRPIMLASDPYQMLRVPAWYTM